MTDLTRQGLLGLKESQIVGARAVVTRTRVARRPIPEIAAKWQGAVLLPVRTSVRGEMRPTKAAQSPRQSVSELAKIEALREDRLGNHVSDTA